MARRVRRFTVCLSTELYEALKLKAGLSGKTVSALVGDLVRQGLAEDLQDLRLLSERAQEPVLTYEELLAELKARGA
ncbi:hypothetical protein EG19_05225 [Thermoanaerobaculum aquaticum]|uniref:CopG family transcriptional regulator n=1 Tax=Thermoanaerobaculum aquaticum TaxID=1312852 RepID=A0A062XRZ3_9BACT|nr:hypothetical protein [Thermoanaerobaculum aquaticum]KDA53603.1 hypothetical protein EG19_05225 [Thermoanaerobaculum aquaticum]